MVSVMQANSKLGWDILKKLYDDDGDLLAGGKTLSPLSLTIAVGMLAGAADTTKKRDLSTKLGVQPDGTVENEFAMLLSSLAVDKTGSPLAIANGVFTDESITLYQKYVDFLTTFKASITQYPSLPAAVDDINAWISDNTLQLIQEMLSKGVLKSTHVVLVNAIAFKGMWIEPFNPSETKNHPFYATERHKVSVKMMFRHDAAVLSFNAPTFTALCLPYKSATITSATSLIAFLPNNGVNLRTALEDISSTEITLARFSKIEYRRFGFPRFELRSDLSVLDVLQSLGYPVKGSYSQMGTGGNRVDKVLHRAVVKVDEEGTVAAAATAVLMTRRVMRQTKPDLIFDRPFAFTIVENKTNMVLFMGIFSVQ